MTLLRHRAIARRDAGVRDLQREYLENERRRGRLLASCTGIAAISIPLILGIVPPNGVYGFRTSLTMSSPAIWYPANAFMGWALLASVVIGAALLLTLPTSTKRWTLWASFLIPVFSALAASLLYLSRLR